MYSHTVVAGGIDQVEPGLGLAPGTLSAPVDANAGLARKINRLLKRIETLEAPMTAHPYHARLKSVLAPACAACTPSTTSCPRWRKTRCSRGPKASSWALDPHRPYLPACGKAVEVMAVVGNLEEIADPARPAHHRVRKRSGREGHPSLWSNGLEGRRRVPRLGDRGPENYVYQRVLQ